MTIDLPHHFELRGYQHALHEYMVSPTDAGKRLKDRRVGKRAVIVWHRRTGKDKTCFAQEIVPGMFERVGVYHYYFPTATDGRKILWNGIDKAGFPLINHFPRELIESKRDTDMVIKAKNGSMFQIIGSDRVESVGTNPVGCVFSEFSKQNPRWWDLVRPILAENEGWAIFNWTPRGKNHAYRMDKMARNNPKWFFEKLTVSNTNAISMEAIQDDRDSGMSEAMIQQEYYCSYDLSVEGAYYSDVLGKMMDNGQIGVVNHNPYSQVYAILDFGYTSALWFVQEVGVNPHIIRYYEECGRSIEGWAELLLEYKEKYNYNFAKVIVPCDMDSNATRIITGDSALETLRALGLTVEALEKEVSVQEGIVRTQKFLHRCYIDGGNCEQGLVRLESYHEKLNKAMSTEMNPVFTGVPEKDGNDHGADGMRYVSKAFEAGMICNQDDTISKAAWQALKEQYA